MCFSIRCNLATHHFLQTIDEVTDDDAKAFELLEHGAQLLAGAFAHVCARLVRLLADDVGRDGGTHVHDFCALAHHVGIIWKKKKKNKRRRKRPDEQTGADW